MTYGNKWTIDRKLGEGGQGEVFLVRGIIPDEQAVVEAIAQSIAGSNALSSYGTQREDAKRELAIALRRFVKDCLTIPHGALKKIQSPSLARDPKLASERAAREIEAMLQWKHPNLLRLIDSNAEELWYVSEYHEKGSLDHHSIEFAGNLLKTLEAVRPLVEGVAMLHRNQVVHRDIKPQNIFVGADSRLVLGDFGLICDLKETRITDTYANVGTRDWMPAWAMSKRIEELTPTFDVFALGKIIWSLVSGRTVLTLWYYDEPDNNVESLFTDRPEMQIANRLFAKCIVEREAKCLPSAESLLHEIDSAIKEIKHDTNFFAAKKRICKVCGKGEYSTVSDLNLTEASNFGLKPAGMSGFKIFSCNHCGHVQLFHFPNKEQPHAAWSSEQPTLAGLR